MVALAQAPATRRPTVVTTVAILLALSVALGLLGAPAGLGEVGAIILIPALIFAGLRLVAAIGLWRCRRWAAILGFVATLLDTLLALPGVFAAPNVALRALSTLGVVLGLTILILLVLPSARRAYS